MYLIIKRILDIILSSIGLIILSPMFISIIVLIKLDSPGPVFFQQKRIGKHKKTFNMIKFRTMKTEAPKDIPTHMLENPEQYITRIGKILRKTSLDELPQIWNILTGKMTIVGPRPALWNQYDLIYERERYKANDLPVGLTGYAQINGRDELSIKQKAQMDGEYAKKISFSLDIWCLIKTIAIVIKKEGIIEGKREADDTVIF